MITTKIDFEGLISIYLSSLIEKEIDNNIVKTDMHNIPCNEMIVRCQTPNNL